MAFTVIRVTLTIHAQYMRAAPKHLSMAHVPIGIACAL